ncbi:MAG: NUDIX hydrolase [archaeon]|nr:NUDIX hydrolase [archaeon]
MDENSKRPKVGLSVIIMKNPHQVLMGKRKGSHGAGTLSFPGGHLEGFETFWNCATRELEEEIGFVSGLNYHLSDYNPITITNDFFQKEQKHYVTLYLRADYLKGIAKNKEPEKCEGWAWYDWKKLPELNLFIPIRNLIKQGYNPFTK